MALYKMDKPREPTWEKAYFRDATNEEIADFKGLLDAWRDFDEAEPSSETASAALNAMWERGWQIHRQMPDNRLKWLGDAAIATVYGQCGKHDEEVEYLGCAAATLRRMDKLSRDGKIPQRYSVPAGHEKRVENVAQSVHLEIQKIYKRGTKPVREKRRRERMTRLKGALGLLVVGFVLGLVFSGTWQGGLLALGIAAGIVAIPFVLLLALKHPVPFTYTKKAP